MLDEMVRHAGEWLRGSGPMNEIVISSRVRLARNVAGYPFLSRTSENQRSELMEMLRPHVVSAAGGAAGAFLDMNAISDLDQQVLVERHLVSRNLAEGKGSRGVAISKTENVSVMVNEEDHLRIQVLRSGLQLDEIWRDINALDDKLESKIEYAFHPRYGYLTACPTNVGTGIRVSVMLHLPGLKLTGEIERVFRAARDMRLAVRGLFGEGTEAAGDFFQVSNQVTLGRTEEDTINDFRLSVIPKIIEYEQKARRTLVSERTISLDDRVWRSLGTLRHARTISSEEVMLHLSHLRLGVHLGRLKDVTIQTINDLFLMSQPAHLQKVQGARLTGEQRSIARAELIRRRLTPGMN
ncbi:Protein arginine kinase [Phycisphaerae bacterium RAS2]|nr:Protein arginine kinase [Phycisphaerae bacterium RAS2]